MAVVEAVDLRDLRVRGQSGFLPVIGLPLAWWV
jgi:hypothetical protein